MQFICVLVESKMSRAVAGWYMWTATRPLSGLKVIVPLCPLLEKYSEIRVVLPGEGTAAARAALPIPTSVCSISSATHSYQCVQYFKLIQIKI